MFEEIRDQDEIKRIANQYSIPVEAVLRVRRMECKYVGGGSTYIVYSTAGVGWAGCGHPRCTQCQFESARGVVGDAAVEAYRERWLAKIEQGQEVPGRVRRYLRRNR